MLRGGDVQLQGLDIQDWTITFVHTGLDSPIGERLRRARRHVADGEMFLAAYADVLTDAALDRMVEQFRASDAVGPLPAARAGSCGRQHRRPRAFVDAVDSPWASPDTREW